MKLSKTYLIGAVLLMWASACKDADTDLFNSPVQDDSSIGVDAPVSTVSALTFAWDAVPGVMQYGYQLADSEGKVVREGVTSETTITFTRLTSASTYCLTVEAYGANGVATKRFKFSATTDEIVKLASPDAQSMAVSQDKGKITVSWDAVDNAAYYLYALVDAATRDELQSGTTDEPNISLGNLPLGQYNLAVTACNDDEAYSTSDAVDFTFARNREVSYSKQVVYERHTGETLDLVMNVYDDGVFSVQNFSGINGYNLEFIVDDEENVIITNDYYSSGAWKYVETGFGDGYICIYQDGDYCYYDADETGKHVYMFTYWDAVEDGGYDTISWDVPVDEFNIDAMVGEYSMIESYFTSYYFLDCDNLNAWYDFDDTLHYPITITKIDDTTVEIKGLMGLAYSVYSDYADDIDYVYAYPDFDAMTLTIPAQYLHYYDEEDGQAYDYEDMGCGIYNDSYKLEGSIVGTFDENFQITISGFSFWYTYFYSCNTSATFVKN